MIMEVEAANNLEATSPPGSPTSKTNKLKHHEADDNSNHSEKEHEAIANNNEGSGEDSNSKTNGVMSEDNECSADSTSKDGSVDQKENHSKLEAVENHVSSEDKSHTNNKQSGEESNEEDEPSEEGSDDESEEQNLKETVSLNSDSDPETVDDSTRDAHSGSENNDVVMLEANNEVHEINSEDDDDDCVVTNEEDNKSVNGSVDSDVEMEEVNEDPLNHNDEKVKVKNPKSLLKPDLNHSNTSVTLVNTKSILSPNKVTSVQPTKATSVSSTINVNENVVMRGSTITDITVKSNNISVSQSPPTKTNEPLLPTLTDDMFVVEAPSFIVPYVYEKPSIKPFREFVDILGKELEEKEAKEEKERLEKEKEEKERRKKEKEEKRAKGEQVEDSEEETENKSKAEEEAPVDLLPEILKGKVEKVEKKKGKRRRNEEDDDASWDGESESSEEEAVSEDDELSTVVIKDKDDDDIEEIKNIAKMSEETHDLNKSSSTKTESFFDNNLGKFFMNIGLNLVQEFVQTDLLKQQKRRLRKENKSQRPHTKDIEMAIKYLSQNIQRSKQQNEPYNFKRNTCKFCLFRTESELIMSHHLETPHMKNNIYTCNFCSFEVRSPHDILFHTEAEHNIRSRLERAPAYHQCANCPFEDNGKGKLARHLVSCAKKFKPEINLAPPADWEPPAKIPKLTRGRNSVVGAYTRMPGTAPLGRPPTISGPNPLGRPRGPAPGAVNRSPTMLAGAPMMRGGVMIRPTTPINPLSFPANQNPVGKISHQPSISITPLPRAPQPAPASGGSKTQGSFVICEICDGYIKDLEQLRSHMQWIHKVKIHPKMIYNRPPLNCQKCQFRFFTDQGLERHLLGSHGLVTSSMQETANQGKDSGRCPVCGRVYQWKLLNHVAKDHNMTLKPAHLSYKCTVCTATFGMYKQFESHVYSAHSAVGKRMADGKPPARVGNSSITIVPAGKTGAKV